jgi:hypothetical protein|tara:strand:- start:193 stop:942 length:750 start_codon:yes stop_codon:yes gene_type:complete
MPAVSKKQQRFFGMVRAAQKGEMKNPSSEVSDVASEISMKDAKKFAKTKHKGLPEKKKVEEAIKRDEYGDPIGGPKISKKQVKKNLASNAKDEKIVHSEGAAWTKKAGQNKEGGLNEKGRKSYERENPGSDLKAPSKEKGNKRRKSFCARMKGMKKKLTSAKTARDPDSRINKSLRAWNCSYEPQGKLVEDYEERAKSRQKFVDFYKKAKEAKAKKQADATRSDSRKHGIKFSDAKGSGRIKAGKKVYD